MFVLFLLNEPICEVLSVGLSMIGDGRQLCWGTGHTYSDQTACFVGSSPMFGGNLYLGFLDLRVAYIGYKSRKGLQESGRWDCIFGFSLSRACFAIASHFSRV